MTFQCLTVSCIPAISSSETPFLFLVTYVHTYITHTHMLETRSKYHCMGLVHSDPFIVMPLKDTHVRTCCHSVFEQRRARKNRCGPYEAWEREEEEGEPPCLITQHH